MRELGAQQQQPLLSRKGSAQADAEELRSHMAGVAEFAFSAFEERLRFLKTCASFTHSDHPTGAFADLSLRCSVNGDATTPESRLVIERYYAIRPRFIRTLGAPCLVSSLHPILNLY